MSDSGLRELLAKTFDKVVDTETQVQILNCLLPTIQAHVAAEADALLPVMNTLRAQVAELRHKLNYYDSVVTYTSMIALTDGDVVPAVKPLKQFLEEHEAKLKEAESENANLRTQLEGLVETTREVMKLIDDGYLIRDISKDHERDWAIRQMKSLATLSRWMQRTDELAAVLNQPK